MKINKNFYSKLQLGMELNVCVRTIDNWIAAGKISYSKLGKRVIFSQRDLDEFIEINRKDAYLYEETDRIYQILEKKKMTGNNF